MTVRERPRTELLCLVLVCLSSQPIYGGPIDKETLGVLRNAYVSNRESFVQGQGEYLVRFARHHSHRGDEEIESDAVMATTRVRWAFRDGMCRYDSSCQFARTPPKNADVNAYRSTCTLTDGVHTFEIIYPIDRRTHAEQAEVVPGIEEFHRRVVLQPPLGVGFPECSGGSHAFLDFGGLIDAALNNRLGITASLDGQAEIAGRSTAVVTIRHDGKDWRRYWIDVERGGIPLQMEQHEAGTLLVRDTNRDLRETGDGWLPFRVRRQFVGQPSAHELTVVSFDDKRPADDVFQIPLHPVCFFTDRVKNVFYEVEHDTHFGFGKLAGRVSQVATVDLNTIQGPRFDLAERPRNRHGSVWFWVCTTASTATLVVGVYLVFKRAQTA